MKMLKKNILLAVCLIMVMSIIAACSSTGANTNNEQSSTSAPTSTQKPTSTAAAEVDPYAEHMEISIAWWGIDGIAPHFENDRIFQEITKKFNISIKPMNTTWDDYGQKIQMWAASGQLPDIFAIDAIGTQYQKSWVSQGVVKPLPDLSEYPHLAAYFEAPDISGLIESDGKYYMVPRRMFPSVDWSALDRVVFYRWDLAQQAGITKEPETWDEFNAMFAAIVEKDPQGKNIAGLTSTTTKMLGGLFWLYGNPVATSDGSGADYKWIKEDGKFVPAVFSSKALPALQNMREMYEKGLIDPDIALTKMDLAEDKFVSGDVAALLSGGGHINLSGINTQLWKKAHPDTPIMDAVKVLKPLAPQMDLNLMRYSKPIGLRATSAERSVMRKWRALWRYTTTLSQRKAERCSHTVTREKTTRLKTVKSFF